MPGNRASILVVDDTPANLQVLAGMLKDRGYKVRPVPSGKLALLAARRDPPDLILLDINMPEMNGYEVCEHLKADDMLKGIPVIFISALTEQLDKVKAFATGGVDYITKPFQMEELHARVETHLKLRRLQIELEETNARLARANGRMSRDLRGGGEDQETFLPREAPRVPGMEFAWATGPAPWDHGLRRAAGLQPGRRDRHHVGDPLHAAPGPDPDRGSRSWSGSSSARMLGGLLIGTIVTGFFLAVAMTRATASGTTRRSRSRTAHTAVRLRSLRCLGHGRHRR